MSLTINDISDAGKLSVAAYDLRNGLGIGPFQSAGSAITAAGLGGWNYVNPSALGINPAFVDSEGYFNNLNSQALLAFNPSTGTLAISFRGSSDVTDLLDDVIGGGVNWGVVYGAFSSFVSAVLSNAASFGATRILITGHSLGGAMAEEAMARNLSDTRLVGVTFGSPGTNDPNVASSAGSDQRLLNIGHADLYGALGAGDQGDAVFRATLGEHVQGSDIRVNLPDEPDYSLRTTAGRAFAGLDYGQHEPFRYNNTAQAIAAELTKNLNDGHPFDPRAFSYVIGTNTGNITLDGSSGANVIIGDSGIDAISGYAGNDILDGGGGDDRLIGGAGNDIIYGGTGTDTAVYSFARNHYNISVRGNSVIVAATGSDGFEGTDTVSTDATYGVEKFEFYDGTFTLSQLVAQALPPSDTTAPTLTNKSPADNSTAVPVASNIGLTFSESVFKGSGNIDIHKSDNSLFERISVADATQVTFSGTAVTINPSFDLAPGTGYYINIDPGAFLDQSGNAYLGIANQTDFNFVTAAVLDTSAPVLSAASPSDNAGGVAAAANIGLTFNEIVVPGAGNIDIHNSNGTIFKSIAITDAGQVAFSSNTVTVNPNIDLAAGSDYYVTVASGAIRDLAGNSFAGISSNTALNFTTASSPVLPPAHDNSIFLSIVDNSITEGNSGTKTLSFGVNLTGAGAGTQTVSVQYTTQDIAGAGSPATAGQDYIATSSVLVIPAGQTFGQIDVKVFGDTFLEADEVFRLVLTQPSSNVTLLNSSGQASSSIFATGFIDNDDQASNHNPATVSDIAITAPGITVQMDVLSNDSDVDSDALHVSQLFSVALGGTTPIAGNGAFSLSGNGVSVTPNPGAIGIFSYNYVVDDGRGGLANGYASVIVSGDGSPAITNSGTVGNDIIVGAGGNDTLSGGFGDDIIYGGPGSDRIDGGPGFNYFDLRQAAHAANIQFRDPWISDDGDGGHDILTNIEGVLGTPFNDTIDGASHNVQYIATGYRFYGGDGNDRLTSDAGDDVLDGGAGDDILIFGSGRDIAFGGAGNDQIYSFNGTSDILSDTLDGGPGDDMLYSDLGHSADSVSGDSGNDYIQFSDGDTVSGGTGADRFFFDGVSPGTAYHATITDLEPGDTIQWQFQNAIIVNNIAHWFIGPVAGGNGTSTALDHVEFASANGQTTLYFGFDANPGADFVLSMNGAFKLSQFRVDDSNTTLAIHVVPATPIISDFSGDSFSDILFRNNSTGDTGYTDIHNNVFHSLGGSPVAWSVVGLGDYNGDSFSDTLFRNNSTGDTGYTDIHNNVFHSLGGSPAAWSVVGSGDYNGDNFSDILFRNNATGDTGYTDLHNNVFHSLGGSPAAWRVVGSGDYNGDSFSDILFRNNATGDTGYTDIHNNVFHSLGGSPVAWSVVGSGDYNGDAFSDILFRNNSTGDTGYTDLHNNVFHSLGGSPVASSVVGSGDYNGDAFSDILFRNNSTGDTGYTDLHNNVFHSLGGSPAAYLVMA
jgi:Ca2+-binding RTX toxin-like protein/methionine-rich copper-binding protein CopC